MNQKKRALSTKLALVFAAVVLVAFSFSQALAADDQVLRLANKYGDAKSLDAHRATGSQDRLIVNLVFNVLGDPGNTTDLIWNSQKYYDKYEDNDYTSKSTMNVSTIDFSDCQMTRLDLSLASNVPLAIAGLKEQKCNII